MTKRNGGFDETKCKKLKLDNLDDLWGDDHNIQDIDECLILATQVCEQDGLNCTQQNVSILPNYSIFKQDNKNIITSTQENNVHINGHASSSFTQNFNNCRNSLPAINGNLHIKSKGTVISELEMKIQKLEEKCESKDGEVSILRTQLKETKTNLDADYQKKEKEWTEKSNFFTKEIISIKSQLEFKNLEVVNLKNKILEISKAYATDNLLNSSQCFAIEKDSKVNVHTYLTKYKLEPILDIKFPLIKTISPLLLNTEQSENFTINLKVNQINNFLVGNEDDNISKYKNIVESKHFKLNSIYPQIFVLIKANSLDINSKFCYNHINQIVFISKYSLSSFHNYLLHLECDIHSEDVRQEERESENKRRCVDSNLSVFDSRAWSDKEIGIRARQTVGVIAEIFPHSAYLQSTLLNDFNNDQENVDKIFDNYLNLINLIIIIIARIGKADVCEGFLCAAALLLFRISQTKEFLKCYSSILSISKELIFIGLPDTVLKNLILFFKQASVNVNVVNALCKTSGLKTNNSKDESLYFKQDSCVMQVFVVLYKFNFIEKKNTNIDINLSTLQFIMNLLNCNPLWLHYQENNRCDCLREIMGLGINIIHECVKKHERERIKRKEKTCKKGICKYDEILKYSIKVLHIMTFKYFDIINKYSVDSEYKFVINYLTILKDEIKMTEFEYETLYDLNMQEDFHNVKSTSFDLIPIWK